MGRRGELCERRADARNLPEDAQTAPGQEEIGFQSDAENRRLRELSDALAVVAIEQDTEAQETVAIVTSLWKLLAYPNAAASHQGGNVAMDYFPRMIRAGLWIPHGETYQGIASSCPKLVCDGDMVDIYGEACVFGEPTLPVVANMDALERYAGSNARWGNALIIRDFE